MLSLLFSNSCNALFNRIVLMQLTGVLPVSVNNFLYSDTLLKFKCLANSSTEKLPFVILPSI